MFQAFSSGSQSNVALRNVGVGHIERYLDAQKAKGWALPTLAITAYSLQKFFLHAEGRGWVRRGLSFGVPTYAIPRHAFVPKGPSWKDVQQMIASLNDRRPVELRDHAMLRLMAVYGLRGGDLIALHLSDVDFAERILTCTAVRIWSRNGSHSIGIPCERCADT
jgi:site-specific recombinase XerD